MFEGIRAFGDRPVLHDVNRPPIAAHTAVMYGWKRHHLFRDYKNFVYADLGYWNRQTHYRLSVNAWSPDAYVRQGLPDTRLRSFGVDVKPWSCGGDEIIIAGSSAKAAIEHGFGYMEWERRVAEQLKYCGKRLVYRPKPKDYIATPICGVGFDRRPLDVALRSAHAVVTHHSNMAIDALVSGIPVHCETGAAAAFSVPLDHIADAHRLEGREQFLSDVAWLEWSIAEMRSGECWSHIRSLLC